MNFLKNKITFIVGLPGSGKTYLMDSLSSSDIMLLDDFELKDNQILSEDCNYVLTNPYFCTTTKEKIITKIEKHIIKEVDFEFILFENNLENCWYNVQKRI